MADEAERIMSPSWQLPKYRTIHNLENGLRAGDEVCVPEGAVAEIWPDYGTNSMYNGEIGNTSTTETYLAAACSHSTSRLIHLELTRSGIAYERWCQKGSRLGFSWRLKTTQIPITS